MLPQSFSNWVHERCVELWKSLQSLTGGSSCSCTGNSSSFFPSSAAAVQQFFDQPSSIRFQKAGDCTGLESEIYAKSQSRASAWGTRQCDVQNTDVPVFISASKKVKIVFSLDSLQFFLSSCCSFTVKNCLGLTLLPLTALVN